MEKKTAAVIIAAAALISSVVVSQFYADCTLQLRAVGVLAAGSSSSERAASRRACRASDEIVGRWAKSPCWSE